LIDRLESTGGASGYLSESVPLKKQKQTNKKNPKQKKYPKPGLKGDLYESQSLKCNLLSTLYTVVDPND